MCQQCQQMSIFTISASISITVCNPVRRSTQCDQSNYSHIPIEFGQTGISTIRSSDPEKPTLVPNAEWIDLPRRYRYLNLPILDCVKWEIAPFDPPSPKTPQQNETWSGSDVPSRRYGHLKFSKLRGQSVAGPQYIFFLHWSHISLFATLERSTRGVKSRINASPF